MEIKYPFDPHFLLRKKKSLRRNLLQGYGFIEKKIAILGGSTTAEIKDMVEIFLLMNGIKPLFYESDYNRYYEDIMFPNSELEEFKPDVIYIHTSVVNITQFPLVNDSEEQISYLLAKEIEIYNKLWDMITGNYACSIIQNNFELPHYRVLGNLDAYDIHGRSNFISELNREFSKHAQKRTNLFLNDINYLSAWFGLERWYDKLFWYSYKYAMSYEAIPLVSHSVASIISALFGKSKKCLILDLDNTLWGGVIGDDGLNGIQIGKETPVAEAYTEFQLYVRDLKNRGIILSVCSKNDESNAREGFSHPDSILKIDDFSAFNANWQPKHENIRGIASFLNVGVDSLVFADDNPMERDIVRSQEPLVEVPELGNNVTKYINVLDKAGYFETVSVLKDDIQKSSLYADNIIRKDFERKFESHEDFLQSLEMNAEIKAFIPVYLDRITQLINKTNQFNLTTRRYTQIEIENIARSQNYITLYGRLSDKFGDNGLVSIIVGEIRKDDLHIDLWLMSCRVLKRGMEQAMFNEFLERARNRGLKVIYGYYCPTAKNAMVRELFRQLGFTEVSRHENGETIWRFIVKQVYNKINSIIKVNV